MKYLIAIVTTLALAAMVLLAIAIHNTSPIENAVTAPRNTEPSTLKVTPNYGEQKTVSGSYLQPANVCLQNCAE
jgi:negative regulator of sigma E activity